MSELAFLLQPVAREAFFRDYWDRRPLHIPGRPEKFAAVYDVGTWRNFDGVGDLKAVTLDPAGIQVEMPALPEQAGALFLAGFTICADVTTAPRLAPFLQAFRRELEVPGGPAFAKLYASSDGRGFAVHADKHHVFVLQVLGKKHWRFSRTPVVSAPTEGLFIGPSGMPHWTGMGNETALRDDGSPVPPPDVTQFDSALLEPGHLLYLPPGTWHVARAVGHSIAVSISPDRTTVMDVFIRAIQDRFSDRPAWREDLLAPPDEAAAPPGEIAPSVAKKLDALLADLRAAVSGMDPRVLHRLWMRNVIAGQQTTAAPPAAAGGQAGGEDSEPIRRSDTLTRVDGAPLRFLVAPVASGGEERCFFYRGGGEGSLPGSARAFLAELARHTEFRAEAALAWDRKLRFEEVRDFLGVLLAAGVLRRKR
jgi:Cupin superfamily protein